MNRGTRCRFKVDGIQCRLGADHTELCAFTFPPDPEPVDDPVNHPAHYTFGKIEPIDAIEDWGLGFHLGSVVAYIARAKHKGAELQDLKKARWFLDREIARLEKGSA